MFRFAALFVVVLYGRRAGVARCGDHSDVGRSNKKTWGLLLGVCQVACRQPPGEEPLSCWEWPLFSQTEGEAWYMIQHPARMVDLDSVWQRLSSQICTSMLHHDDIRPNFVR